MPTLWRRGRACPTWWRRWGWRATSRVLNWFPGSLFADDGGRTYQDIDRRDGRPDLAWLRGDRRIEARLQGARERDEPARAGGPSLRSVRRGQDDRRRRGA